MGKLVEIEGHELKNGNIEKISLVTHGAIRQPFKILKTEEIDAGKTGGIKNVLSKVFGQDQTRDEENAVAALFVRKAVAQKWLPLIRKQGFRVEKAHASIEGDIVVLKQEGYTDECNGSVVAINPDVAVQLSNVSKFFDPFPASSSFSDNVAAGSFWPGMHNAMESLAETVWNVLNESDSPENAASDVAKQVKAFSSHLNNLVAELPTTVFKMEQESLTKEFEGSTVSTSATETIVSNEDKDMSTVVTKHAPATDLDGLFDEAPATDVVKTDDAAEDTSPAVTMFAGEEQLTKEAFDALADDAEVLVKTEGAEDATWVKSEILKGDEGAPKSGGSPGNPVVDNTSDTGAVDLDEGGVPAGFRKEERVMKSFDEKGNIIEKFAEFLINEENGEEIFVKFIDALSEADAATDKKADYTAEQNALFAQMGVMVKGIEALTEAVAAQNVRIDAVSKTAETAQETAEEVVVLPTAADDLGNPVQSRNGQQGIQKNAAPAATGEVTDIFKGLLPGIEGNAA